ncbi:MAG: sigma-70 family RNA polymerase sigma factor [Peptostreptococcus sp.]|uniref:sigma-70 family RNA polymerase sigma factor n=1 Tax=Peptostreptococcus sp. TaxID=1262 RepID=UPI002FC7BDCD
MKITDIKIQIKEYMKEFDSDTGIVKNIERDNEEVYLDVEDYNDHIDRILVWKSTQGDELARELFILDKLEYVQKIVRSDSEMIVYKHKGLEDEDLIQTGVIGVIETIDRYDFRKNVKVRTFLACRIRFAIKNAYRKYGSVSISREANSVYNKCSQVYDISNDKIPIEILKCVSDKYNLETKKISECILAVKLGNSVLHYDTEGYIEADNKTLGRHCNKVVDQYQNKMGEMFDYRLILDAISKLDTQEEYIMTKIFIEDKTQKELAEELGYSVTTIGKIKKRAIRNIRIKIIDESEYEKK